MLLTPGSALQYLIDYRDGKIKEGLKIGCPLDDYLRFKPNQLVIILGHDNVGKSYWINWYFLNLALKHGLRFCIWSGENSRNNILRDMIQMYYGRNFKELSYDEIRIGMTLIESYFTFVANDRLYKPMELLDIFKDSECNVALIDPFTGLDRQMSYEGNYEFLNKTREFCNRYGVTIYINTHPNSESGRSGNIYNDGEYKGHLKAPLKDHIEGGKSFTNRCDDMIIIHRLVKHEKMKYVTWINIEKVKDMDTGGRHTALNDPIFCDFNYGNGFMIDGVDPLQSIRKSNGMKSKNNLNDFLDTVKFDQVNGKRIISTSEKLKNLNNDPF